VLQSEKATEPEFHRDDHDRVLVTGRAGDEELHCMGRKPPFWAVKRTARPYKSAIETRFTIENAKGA
jgi:hypothetical protein